MDIATFETPNSMDCIRCGDCMAACPTGAISSTWGKMGQTVKSRCFVDDEDIANAAAAPATTSVVRPGTIRYLGILMLVGGLVGFATCCYFGLYKDFLYRMTVAKLEHVGAASLVLGSMKLLATTIVTFTGFFLIRNANDAEKAKTANEKVRIAFILYLLGIVAFIIGLAFDVNLPELLAHGVTNQEQLGEQLGQIGLLKDQIFYNVFCMTCLPILTLLAFVL